MAKNASRDTSTSYAVGSSTASRGRVFTEYFVPGGRRVRVIDRNVFNGAVRKSGELLTEFSNEMRGASEAAKRAR